MAAPLEAVSAAKAAPDEADAANKTAVAELAGGDIPLDTEPQCMHFKVEDLLSGKAHALDIINTGSIFDMDGDTCQLSEEDTTEHAARKESLNA